MTFDFLASAFRFTACAPITFDAWGSGNWLRGAFGSALREEACKPDCPGRAGLPVSCPHREDCSYSRIFEPVGRSGPSGLADPPRPFVFRLRDLANRSVAPGGEFRVHLNFFDTRRRDLPELARAFGRLARAELIDSSTTLFSLSLDPILDQPTHLSVHFLSPADLKSTAPPFEFSTLFARARDRVSTLRTLYGPGPLDVQFRALGERARAVRTTRMDLRRVRRERTSGRTGQTHSIGGFVGVAEYEGPIAEFLPILQAARWTGVGRHCVWGNGEIAIEAK